MRVLSLLPAATEIVCLLGGQDDLVGRSHACDHPVGLDEIPVVTKARKSVPRTPEEVTDALRKTKAALISVFRVNASKINALKPDVVLTQDLAEVTGVPFEDIVADLKAKKVFDPMPAFVRLAPTRFDGMREDIRKVAEAIGRADGLAKATADIESRMQKLTDSVGDRPKPKVVTIEWAEPALMGGLWMADLVAMAGGEVLGAVPGEPAKQLDMETLAGFDPDVVLFAPRGMNLKRASKEVALLKKSLPWRGWRAIRSGRLYVADGNALFNRAGPRLIDSAEMIAALLHRASVPALVDRHRKWVRRVTAAGTVLAV